MVDYDRNVHQTFTPCTDHPRAQTQQEKSQHCPETADQCVQVQREKVRDKDCTCGSVPLPLLFMRVLCKGGSNKGSIDICFKQCTISIKER